MFTKGFCKNGSQAFTLAEVLITLGIIGVVAAMTIPTLVSKYEKKVWITQLKKQVNVLSNNFQRIKADEGVDKISQTSLVNIGSLRTEFNQTLYQNYFKLDKATSPDIESLGDGWLQTKDGAVQDFNLRDSINSTMYEVSMDINGQKGPNKVGRDRFIVYFNDFGVVSVPPAVLENRELCVTKMNAPEYNYIPDEDEASPAIAAWYGLGGYCFAKVMYDGWEMNY